jgi:hypothetical protein
VNRRLKYLVGAIVLVVIGMSLGLLALLRVQEAREFHRRHPVQTYGGTNYVVQLMDVVAGRAEAGCLLLVYLRLQNPNPYEVTLSRNWFVLVDHAKGHYLPSTTSTQPELIKLPANGVLDREMLSFTVADDAFAGTVALLVGQNQMLLIKDAAPVEAPLRNGEFRSFQRRHW